MRNYIKVCQPASPIKLFRDGGIYVITTIPDLLEVEELISKTCCSVVLLEPEQLAELDEVRNVRELIDRLSLK